MIRIGISIRIKIRTSMRIRIRIRTWTWTKIRMWMKIRTRIMIRTYAFIAKRQQDTRIKAAGLVWPGGMSGAPESGAPLQLQRRVERSHGERTYLLLSILL